MSSTADLETSSGGSMAPPVSAQLIGKESSKRLIDIIPLTYMQFDEVTPKDKAPNNFCFALVDSQNKRWRTVFSASTKYEFEAWKQQTMMAMDLARPKIFGTTINDASLKCNRFVPIVVDKAILVIEQGIKTEGLFRVPGDANEIERFIKVYDGGNIPSFKNQEIHLACGLLKSYIRDLREPIIPPDLIDSVLAVASIPKLEQVAALKSELNKLPQTNRCVLYRLSMCLGNISKEAQDNKMDTNNLAVVWGPTAIRKINSKSKTTSDLSKLDGISVSATIMHLIIERREELFTEIDKKLCDKPLIEHWQDPCLAMPQLTPVEQEAINAILAIHQRPIDPTWSYVKYFNITLENSKTHTNEPRILVLDYNRMYIFLKGGRLEYSWNFLELDSITSNNKNSISITYKGAGPKSIITIFPVSFGSFDMDHILEGFELTLLVDVPTVGDGFYWISRET